MFVKFIYIIHDSQIYVKINALLWCFVNTIKQPNGTMKSITPRQVADLLGHSTSEITERYYVKKDTAYLNGITDGFEM